MDLTEYARFDGLGLAELVRKKEISPQALSELMVQGVEKINPGINAVIEVYRDRIREVNKRFIPGRPFSGVPFLLKDASATEAGQRQETGSRLKQGYVAETDAFLTTRFREAGAVLLGRTTCPEMALAATTESILTGATRNPWDLERMAGGSSGGAAAAVAAGILPVAHGSDGGGSIRIPAACCGLVGLKPSRGRVTSGPDADEGIFGLALQFVLSRTVRDTAAMLDAVTQPAPGDPYVIRQPRRPFMQELRGPTGKLRIAYTAKSWTGNPVDAEIAQSVRTIAGMCAEMGHHVEEAMPVIELEPYYHALSVMWGSYLVATCNLYAELMGRAVDARYLEPVTLEIYHSATDYTATDVLTAKAELNRTSRRVGQFFQNCDLLLTPTIAQPPAPLGTIHQNQQISRADWYVGTSHYNCFTNLFNATGLPAISLPLCQSSAGLPIGLQFVAGFGEEALLIRMASAFEQAIPWIDRRPPVHVSNP
ncbi:amidase [bacterium]|nr:amidase [bacterium]